MESPISFDWEHRRVGMEVRRKGGEEDNLGEIIEEVVGGVAET